MKGNERVRNFLKKLYARETSILKSTLKISIFHPLVFLNFIQIVIRDKVKIEIIKFSYFNVLLFYCKKY